MISGYDPETGERVTPGGAPAPDVEALGRIRSSKVNDTVSLGLSRADGGLSQGVSLFGAGAGMGDNAKAEMEAKKSAAMAGAAAMASLADMGSKKSDSASDLSGIRKDIGSMASILKAWNK